MSDETQSLDYTLMALADPTRRAILERLFKGEARVTDLAAPFTMSLNSVSKHIRILERARLVERRKSGRDHFLKFNPQALEDVSNWIESRRPQWRTDLDNFAALMNESKKERGWKLPWLEKKS